MLMTHLANCQHIVAELVMLLRISTQLQVFIDDSHRICNQIIGELFADY